MKKNILFISSNMDTGGFQKSLVSLLSYFDYDKYNVDLLLFSPNGIFMDLIPPQVNLISIKINENYFNTFSKCIVKLLKDKSIGLLIYRIIQAIISKIDRGYGGIVFSKVIPKINKEYDVVVDYNGQYILYYMIDKLKAKKKITYFHNDYNKWPYYKNADKYYFNKVDYIVTVSELCKKSICENFPNVSNKVNVIENIITTKTVNVFNNDEKCFKDDDFEGYRIVTVGRLCDDKGPDIAIEALKILIDKGYDVRWYWVGPGESKKYLSMIKDNGMERYFKLMGGTNNPYSFMKKADIMVFPSRFEGKAVAIEEAKVLNKPIVATNFSTVHDQLEDELTGIITEMNATSLSFGIERILKDKDMKNKLTSNLKNTIKGNEYEIYKLYKLIEQ